MFGRVLDNSGYIFRTALSVVKPPGFKDWYSAEKHWMLVLYSAQNIWSIEPKKLWKNTPVYPRFAQIWWEYGNDKTPSRKTHKKRDLFFHEIVVMLFEEQPTRLLLNLFHPDTHVPLFCITFPSLNRHLSFFKVSPL